MGNHAHNGRSTNEGVGGVTQALDGDQPPPAMTLADKLDWLFEHVKGPNGRKPSPRQVGDHVFRVTGVRCSRNHISDLRSGATANPTLAVLEGIADFFDVDMDYFTNDNRARMIQASLDFVLALRNDRLRAAALHEVLTTLSSVAPVLSAVDLHTIRDTIREHAAAHAAEAGDQAVVGPGLA